MKKNESYPYTITKKYMIKNFKKYKRDQIKRRYFYTWCVGVAINASEISFSCHMCDAVLLI